MAKFNHKLNLAVTFRRGGGLTMGIRYFNLRSRQIRKRWKFVLN